MTALKYWDAASNTYKSISGIPGPVGPQGPQGPTQGLPAGGAAGLVLTKNSATDYDTAWASPTIISPWGRNVLINGNFERGQRIGEAGGNNLVIAASSTSYHFDRWYTIVGANLSSIVQYNTALAPNYVGNLSVGLISRQSGQTGVTQVKVAQPLDADQINHIQGKFVTLSVRFATNSGFTGTSLTVSFTTGTGAPAKLGSFTGPVTVISQSVATTPSMGATTVSYTSSSVVPANATQGEVGITWTPVGTAGAGDGIILANVQLEIGSQFTGFEYRPASVEWQMCQRYYCKSFAAGTQPAQNVGSAAGSLFITQAVGASIAGQWGPLIAFPSRMRGSPTITLYSPASASAQIRNIAINVDWSATGVQATNDVGATVSGTTAVGSAAGNVSSVHWTAEAEI